MTAPTMRPTAMLAALTAVMSLLQADAQDWPQWRGPNRDGITVSASDPLSWPAALARKWQLHVGIGHASPIVVGKRAFVFTRLAEDEVVSAVDIDSGKRIWRQSYRAPYSMNSAATAHGKGPKSTPVYRDGRLCTFGISGILSCFDAATGKVLWRKEYGGRFRVTSPLYGAAMSPLIERGLVITHVGGSDSGALLALDVASGQERWSWSADGPGYASPIAVTLDGVRQIVTQSQKNIVGISASDGRLLWSSPLVTPWVQNIVTPVASGDILVFSGLDQGIMAVRVTAAGGRWSVRTVWTSSEDGFYMSSPVVVGGRLVGMSHKRRGELVCLDAASGRKVWAGPPRWGENAAMVGVGKAVLVLSDGGELTIVDASATEFRPVRRFSVAESATWAHPVLSGRHLLIKDSESLTLWAIP